uniref:Uncharacterized protein n=2 Tax=Lotharella globosa TaxID=91324 RepID=A0A7S3ZCQ8_9EUKA
MFGGSSEVLKWVDEVRHVDEWKWKKPTQASPMKVPQLVGLDDFGEPSGGAVGKRKENAAKGTASSFREKKSSETPIVLFREEKGSFSAPLVSKPKRNDEKDRDPPPSAKDADRLALVSFLKEARLAMYEVNLLKVVDGLEALITASKEEWMEIAKATGMKPGHRHKLALMIKVRKEHDEKMEREKLSLQNKPFTI